MFERDNKTIRVFVDIEGWDDQGMRRAFAWLIEAAELTGKPGVIFIPTKRQAENLSPVLGAAAAEALRKGRAVRAGRTSLELMTPAAGGLRGVAGRAVMALWQDDKALTKLDDQAAAGICAVPWLRNDISSWKRNWSPRDLATDAAPVAGRAARSSQVSNPVVAEALKSLTVGVNLGTGLGHPRDRDSAIHLFRTLRASGEAFDPAEVRSWAVNNGWTSKGAAELGEVAAAVSEGRRIQTRDGSGWKKNIISVWRERAAQPPGDSTD